MQPKVTFLSKEMIEQIIDEGLSLLVDPGVRVHNHEALQLLASAGAQVDFDTRIARIPEQIVWNALQTTPGEFYLYDMHGQPLVHYGGDNVHFDPGSAAVTILDYPTGQQRPPTTADFVRFVKLVETLPDYDAQSTAMVCRDVPAEIGDLYRLYLALLYTQKPIVTGAFSKETWKVMWEMLVAVTGGEARLAERPLAVFDICPSPPLLWSDLTCQNLIDCARKGVPAELVSMPLAGATAPVTLAAAVVQHAAESLSGLVISQLANPGAPLVWGGAPATFDMRFGTPAMGDVGTWLIDSAYVEVGKSLGLPTHTYMGSSDSKTLDAQSGLESAGGVFMAALSGVNMVSGGGMIDFLRCQSFEKLVIDAEIIGMARRMLAGVQARDEPLALDLVRRSGHRADYLSRPHTLKWFQQEFFIPSAVIDRGPLDAWERTGKHTTSDRAAARVESLLNTYQPSPLPAELKAELTRITAGAARQVGMDHLPPLPPD
ncbi:MAG: trimethylamine methyltransferase family protein [Anaerolineales bacterium]|nr:trimethylamine methyltransferase family protein [Anaerolineales bacterium]